jgi:hypothetical protein
VVRSNLLEDFSPSFKLKQNQLSTYQSLSLPRL